MADVFDFFLALNLKDDLSEDEVAELRWHLGLGPQPERLSIVAEFPQVMCDDDGEPLLDDEGEIKVGNVPYPLLAQQGPAWVTGGALVSQLVRREERRPGWALTTRQELHPDDFELGYHDKLLDWLASHADYDYVDIGGDGSLRTGGSGNFVGYERWYEDDEITKLLVIKDGKIAR
jgi:hypothetical protein